MIFGFGRHEEIPVPTKAPSRRHIAPQTCSKDLLHSLLSQSVRSARSRLLHQRRRTPSSNRYRSLLHTRRRLLFNEPERLVVMVNYIAKRVPRYIFFGYDETDAIHISDSRLRRSSLRREENLIPCTTVRHTDSRANETPRRKWATSY